MKTVSYNELIEDKNLSRRVANRKHSRQRELTRKPAFTVIQFAPGTGPSAEAMKNSTVSLSNLGK